MKKLITAMVMILMLVAFGVTSAQAASTATINVTVTITATALDVSVTPGNWAIGSISEGGTPDTVVGDPFVAKNNRNASENLTINVAGSTNWTVGSDAGADQFAMKFSTDNGTSWTEITTAGVTLVSNLGAQQQQSFDLQLLAPTSTTVGGTQQTIVVTLTAS